jgi:glucose-6-phosphate 1-dehydrogenase
MANIESQPSETRSSFQDLAPPGPCVFVIFGVAGDLTSRLLLPALYNLARHKLLPRQFALAGFARTKITEEKLRQDLAEDLKKAIGTEADAETIQWLVSRLRFVSSEFESDAGWQELKKVLEELDHLYDTGGNYLFYMATPPQLFLPIVRRLSEAGLVKETEGRWRRVIIEKPFGTDLPSAGELNRHLLELVPENQIYRIDHYLGKETVQNIAVFRFANGIFEPIWNRRYIDHVQITVAESLGVEGRGNYYDKTGALRDMVPNHLVQLLALTAMEAPSSFTASSFRGEQAKVLEAIPPIAPDACSGCVVRGQYAAGTFGGETAPAYLDEPRVDPSSRNETYIAMKLAVDNWRWAGVPFYLRTGKRMKKRHTQIVIQFLNPPLSLFRSGRSMPQPNRLVIGIQPDETITLEFEGKIPGPRVETRSVDMHYNYRDYFDVEKRTGYETLLFDAMIGDSSLFKTAEIIEGGWSIVQPIVDAWAAGRGGPLYPYAAGTDGPDAAATMLERDGRRWRQTV